MISPSYVNDIIEWDVENWSLALQYWSKHSVHKMSSIDALEIGSGNGGLSLWMALNGNRVVCTDINGPSELAVAKHKRYCVDHLIQYESLNALAIPYSEKFDVVLFKSVLGSIGKFDNTENQCKAISEIHRSLKKGGELWFAENMVSSPLHKFLRKRYGELGKGWRYVSIGEMEKYLCIFSGVTYATVGFLGVFGRSARQRSVLGKMDRIVAEILVPKTWRYIIIGIATK